MNNTTHSVWDLYDLLRTARLNVKYYSVKLARVERTNFIIELVLAISAPTSAISGLFFLQTYYGKVAWQILTVIAAFTAIIKPMLRIPEKIRKFEEIVTGYKTLENDLQLISVQIKDKKSYSQNHKTEFKRALERKNYLSSTEFKHVEDKKLKAKLQEEVITELPKDSFFIPEE